MILYLILIFSNVKTICYLGLSFRQTFFCLIRICKKVIYSDKDAIKVQFSNKMIAPDSRLMYCSLYLLYIRIVYQDTFYLLYFDM